MTEKNKEILHPQGVQNDTINCHSERKRRIPCKRAAFSLVEIVVSLIVISVLLAAFIPVITKKLSSHDVTIGAQVQEASDEEEYKIPQSQDDCPSYSIYTDGRTDGEDGGYCVTKWNVGDVSQSGRADFEIPSTVKINTSTGAYDSSATPMAVHKLTARSGSKGSCTVSTDTSTFPENSMCCWSDGETSNECNATDGATTPSTYSGCNRTVCTWHAAVALCENMQFEGFKKGDWHAPTLGQLQIWTAGGTTWLSRYNLGINGLQFCNDNSGYSAVQCKGLNSFCTGAYTNSCSPYRIWLNSVYTNAQAYATHLSESSFGSGSLPPSTAASVRCLAEKVPKSISTSVYEQKPLTKRLQTSETISKRELEITDKIKSIKIADIYSPGGNGGSGAVSRANGKVAPTSQADCPKAADGSEYTVYVNGTCVTKWNLGDVEESGNSDFDISASVNVYPDCYPSKCSNKSNAYCFYKNINGLPTADGETCDSVTGYNACNRTVCRVPYISYVNNICDDWAPNGTSVGEWKLPTNIQAQSYNTKTIALQLQICSNGIDGLDICAQQENCFGDYLNNSCAPSELILRSSTDDSLYYSYYFSTNTNPVSIDTIATGSNISERARSVRCVWEGSNSSVDVFCGGGGASGMHQSDIEIPSDILTSAIGGKLIINRSSNSSVVIQDSNENILWGYKLVKGYNGKKATTSAVGAGGEVRTKACVSYNTSTSSWVLSECDSSAYENSNAGSAGSSVTLTSDSNQLAGTQSGGAYGTFAGGTLGGTQNVNGNQGSAYSAGGGGGCANFSGTTGSGGAGGIGYINVEYVTLE